MSVPVPKNPFDRILTVIDFAICFIGATETRLTDSEGNKIGASAGRETAIPPRQMNSRSPEWIPDSRHLRIIEKLDSTICLSLF